MEKAFLETELSTGKSINKIAVETEKSSKTIQYWCRKHGLKSKQFMFGIKQNIPNGIQCVRCGHSLTDNQRMYCSKKCKFKGNKKYAKKNYVRQKERGARIKMDIVQEKGGKCVRCSYNKNIAALSFHHTNPNTKTIAMSGLGKISLSTVLTEKEKCELICSRCHMEYHYPEYALSTIYKEIERCENSDCSAYDKKKVKAIKRRLCLIFFSGGCCQKCGYNKNMSSLVFHHLNPEEKSFRVDMRKCLGSSWKNLLKEVKKCLLLCSTCHDEIHHPDLNL